MTGLLWVLLGAVLVAVLGLLVLRRRARTAQTVTARRAGQSAPSTRSARPSTVTRPPIVTGPLDARALLEEWNFVTAVSAAESREPLARAASISVVERPVVLAAKPRVALEQTAEQARFPRQELDKPFLTLQELETSVTYGAMRVRIEEVRNHLKAKAFDAGLTGVTAEDSPGHPSVSGSRHLGADLAARIDSMLSEDTDLAELSHLARASKPALVQGIREPGRHADERRGNPSAAEPLHRRPPRRGRRCGRAVRRRFTTATAGTVPSPRRSTRRQSRD